MNLGSMKDMASMMKLAQEAKKQQAKHDKMLQENNELLKRIARTLDEILKELRTKR